MKAQTVLKAEIQRMWITQRRYWFSALMNLIGFGVVSVGAWVALRKAFFRGEGLYRASATLLWPLVLVSFGAAASALKEDIEIGTIEQLYLSAPSVLDLLHIRAVVYFLDTLLSTLPLLLLAGYYLGWDILARWMIVQVVPLWGSLYGLGLILAGLLLVYRRLGEATNLLYMGLMALAVIALPAQGVWAWLQHLFPMVGVSAMPVWPQGWWLRYLAAGAYLWVGSGAFRRLEARAKRLGLIGKY